MSGSARSAQLRIGFAMEILLLCDVVLRGERGDTEDRLSVAPLLRLRRGVSSVESGERVRDRCGLWGGWLREHRGRFPDRPAVDGLPGEIPGEDGPACADRLPVRLPHGVF